MAVFAGSRYLKTPIYARKGQTFIFNVRNKIKFNQDNATYYTVVIGDTIDGIALKSYGNPHLSWAILDSNPQLMSELDLEVGSSILIPPYEEVVKYCE